MTKSLCACGNVTVEVSEMLREQGVYHSIAGCSRTKETMEFTTYVRKPFEVQAVEITAENIAEVAEKIGTLKENGNGVPYIQVNPRVLPNIKRVHIGFFMTVMGPNYRCYSRKLFTENFMVSDESVRPWLEFLDAAREADETHNVFAAQEHDG